MTPRIAAIDELFACPDVGDAELAASLALMCFPLRTGA
jgi:hypothetical protein